MTREEAIERLRNECCKSRLYCELYPDACMKEECEIYMAIEALKERPSGEWIPCSERLPKDGQGVLVTVDDNEFDIKVGSCIYSDGVFFSALYDLDVIAWMPLPDPWKGEKNDD